MIRLGEKFLSDMNLTELELVDKAIACEMLRLCAVQYPDLEANSEEVCYTDDLAKDDSLVRLMDIAGYWSNDLGDILVNKLEKSGIKSPLLDKEKMNAYQVIHSWLKQMGYAYKSVI